MLIHCKCNACGKRKGDTCIKKDWKKGIERGAEADDRVKNGIAENLPH